jgi:Sigma-70 region 2
MNLPLIATSVRLQTIGNRPPDLESVPRHPSQSGGSVQRANECMWQQNENAPSKMPSEIRLIARASRGEEKAFEALFEMHKRRVYSLCLRMTGDPAEAEDCSQEAFLQLFCKWGISLTQVPLYAVVPSLPWMILA